MHGLGCCRSRMGNAGCEVLGTDQAAIRLAHIPVCQRV